MALSQISLKLGQVALLHLQSCDIMRFSAAFSSLLSLALCASALVTDSPRSSLEKRATLDEYIATEAPIALNGILANIGPSGSKSQGAKAGVVLASPTKVDPDYVFFWLRDGALVRIEHNAELLSSLITLVADIQRPDRPLH